MAESFDVSSQTADTNARNSEIENNVYETLDFLDLHQVKGTFFVLGRIAEDQPQVVREIASRGHEVASHSYEHLRLYKLSKTRIQEALVRSRKALEDACGMTVRGFRAPDFSIIDGNMEILDLICEAGYEYDSSLYPIQGHDVYGVRSIGRWIQQLSNGLIEYPPATIEACGVRLPALGGGYFRIYPLAATKCILAGMDRAGYPAMFYIHPYELGSRCPQIRPLSWMRRFRHYANRNKTKDRFSFLFRDYKFGRIDDVLQSRGMLTSSDSKLVASANSQAYPG